MGPRVTGGLQLSILRMAFVQISSYGVRISGCRCRRVSRSRRWCGAAGGSGGAGAEGAGGDGGAEGDVGAGGGMGAVATRGVTCAGAVQQQVQVWGLSQLA